jgi:hypothetical protein
MNGQSDEIMVRAKLPLRRERKKRAMNHVHIVVKKKES